VDRETERSLLAMGYSKADVCGNPWILTLVRWTPFTCVVFMSTGVVLRSAPYMFILGALTLAAAFSPHSFYDSLYEYVVSRVVDLGGMPRHGC
jgi:hypothetical protein